jgi:hypothetical protein
MIGKPGPFPIIESEGTGVVEKPMAPPRRRHTCSNYSKCLTLAAALNWDSFTCRGCCGDIDPSLVWRAHQQKKRDEMVDMICELPEITPIPGHDGDDDGMLKVVGKR